MGIWLGPLTSHVHSLIYMRKHKDEESPTRRDLVNTPNAEV